MPIITDLKGSHNQSPIKIWTDDIEPLALEQMRRVASLPFIHKHVAGMPDIHLGIGATVGSVIATVDSVIPSAVGVDIGCGMNAVQLSLKASDLPDNLHTIRNTIEQCIPLGPGGTHHQAQIARDSDVAKGLKPILEKHPQIIRKRKAHNFAHQVGTLGAGNHFIELCLDEHDYLWVMLHSGSRGIGNQIGQYFIQLARKEMERHQIQLPDRDLGYLQEGSVFFNDYVHAVTWAQDYALLNRKAMMSRVLAVLKEQLKPFALTRGRYQLDIQPATHDLRQSRHELRSVVVPHEQRATRYGANNGWPFGLVIQALMPR